MTKPRDHASVEYAVLKCLGALGQAVEEITGKSERYVRMCSDPDEDRHITVRDAIALDREMRGRGAGHPILDAYGEAVGSQPSGRAGSCPMTAFVAVAAEVGKVAAAISDAMADGKLNLSERRTIAAATYVLIDDARALIETIEPPAQPPRARK